MFLLERQRRKNYRYSLFKKIRIGVSNKIYFSLTARQKKTENTRNTSWNETTGKLLHFMFIKLLIGMPKTYTRAHR